ncbi:phosphate ABC transporter substrate-binding protein [Natranaerofaba carboxydovora]|uniref:phosphate ABC transporter substrate-binding protein n=1 Tax=Natranaerofaba carboxydovora TaxID=2742683 RepID=UPI001F12D72C|nr:phosphate ABC transporter substrate-binding protein [Natranaerofaba carboxydovora]UMZ74252.1 Phosphate-binding protein PstS [Natranaerofaba carboxydovora]
MKKILAALIGVFILVIGGVTAGCGGSGDAGSGDKRDTMVEIQGSDTMVNLNQNWAENYMDENPEKYISVTGGGSGTGIASLINDDVDIAGSSRDMTEEEIGDARENDVDVYEFLVAQDGLAVGVHEDNPVEDLTFAELKEIFTGTVTDWSDFGWDEGGEITVYSRQSNSGTYVYFNENVMDGEDWADDAQFMSGSSAINDALNEDKSGIGYYGVGYVDGVKAINVAYDEDSDYYTPLDAENINEGNYPIARPLYFYTNGVPEGSVKEFLDFVLSDRGQELVVDAGFYQMTPEMHEVNEELFDEIY